MKSIYNILKTSGLSYVLTAVLALSGLTTSFPQVAQAQGLHGITFLKGCDSPTLIGSPYLCSYSIANVLDSGDGTLGSHDTLTISSLVDVVHANPSDVTSANLLPSLTLTLSGGATCNVGQTVCSLPFGSSISSAPNSFYNVDNNDPNPLTDTATLTWQDTCSSGASNCPVGDQTTTSGSQTTIQKLNSTTVTAIHNAAHSVITTTDAGAIVHDSATVTGSGPTPTGDVTFSWFTNGTCSGTPASVSSPTPLGSGSVDAVGFAQGPLNAGSYSFGSHYSGDATYSSSDGACEPLTVNKVSPILSTIPDPSSGNVGVVLNDSATLSGAVSSTGNIDFKLFDPSDATCSGAGVYSQPVPLTGNTAVTSPGYTSLVSGTYRWTADYAGDVNNNAASSGCQAEPVALNKLDSSTVTTIHNANHTPILTASIGDTVHDSATVSGSGPVPTGNVHFTFFMNGVCEGQGSVAGTVALSGGVAHPSDPETISAAGSYSFMAHYEGDSVYNPSEGACEPLRVDKASPGIQTVPSAGGPIGTVLNDTATLSGGSSPTGTVTFKLFAPGDATCSSAVYTDADGAVPYDTSTSGGGYASLVAGTYRWTADYAGDANNNPASSGCDEEQVIVVANPDVHVAKTAGSGTINAGDTASFTITTSNAGPGTATNVVTTDTLPAGLNWTENPDNANCSIAAGVLTCTYATLAEAASDSVTVEAVTNTQVCGTLSNTANVTATNEDQTKTNDNSASASITVNCPVITRTLGFWQTHTQFTENVFASSGPMTLGGMVINDNGKLFGGFYAGISKTSTGAKRSALDQARMQLAQQWLAAKLNCAYFGCPANIQTLLAQASTDFTSGTASQILADASALDAYNNSGDSLGSVSAGAATPMDSKSAANIPFWNVLN